MEGGVQFFRLSANSEPFHQSKGLIDDEREVQQKKLLPSLGWQRLSLTKTVALMVDGNGKARHVDDPSTLQVPPIGDGSLSDNSGRSPQSQPESPPYFSSHAIDHAVAGIGAGAAATVCMNPLDLVKVKFQVDTRRMQPLSAAMFRDIRWRDVATGGRVGREMYGSLRCIVLEQGWKGLYRGLSPNVIGNSTSWGLYFLW